MKLWLVDIIHTLDVMCNTYALMYVVMIILRAGLAKKYITYKNKWNYTDTLMVIAFFGVVFIPSEAALKAMLGV